MANKNGPTDSQFAMAMLVCGVIGALIGFGNTGTLQGACLGAGVGALSAGVGALTLWVLVWVL